jgi:hypothetical protein
MVEQEVLGFSTQRMEIVVQSRVTLSRAKGAMPGWPPSLRSG